MNKELFKQQYRQQRLVKTNNFGLMVAKLMRGEKTSNFDNSHIWALRDTIEAEVDPEIRKRQLAWING